MKPDEQELANCEREIERLAARESHHWESVKMLRRRLSGERLVRTAILARIEAAKGSTDGN